MLRSAHDFCRIEKSHTGVQPISAPVLSFDEGVLRQRQTDLAGDVQAMRENWEDFRAQTIRDRRQVALGQTFEHFELPSGRSFKDASVADINDAGVTIRHANGSARLGYYDLDASQRLFFGLEVDLAIAAKEKEAREAAAYEQWIAERMVAVQEKQELAAAAAKREDEENRRRQSAIAARQVTAAADRPLAQAATSFSNRGYSSYRTYRTYRPTYRHVNYSSTPFYYNYYNPCSPRVYNPRIVTNHGIVFPRHRSFANTTLPSIP